MKRLMLTGLTAVTCAVMAFGADVYWKNGGTGGWGSPDQWEGGEPPKAADVACFRTGANVAVDDTEFAKISAGVSLSLSEGATLTFNLGAGDHDIGGSLSGLGTIVKLGTGTFVSTNNVAFGGTLAVTNGVLLIGMQKVSPMSEMNWPILDVGPQGTLAVGPRLDKVNYVAIQGLRGSGVVSNANASVETQLCLLGSRDDAEDAPEFDFSGRVVGFSLSLGHNYAESYGFPGWQNQIDTTADNLLPIRLFYGNLGVTTFGTANSTLTAFGTTAANHREAVIRSLCAGNESRHPVNLQSTYGWLSLVLDGGEQGGFTQTGTITTKSGKGDNSVIRLVLDGRGGEPCVLKSALNDSDPNRAIELVKRGAGTWRLKKEATRTNRGVVSVESGRLEFESIADAGVSSSLGLSTWRATNYWGSAEESCKVPWAIRLGDGTADASRADLATLAYAGDDDAVCTNRPIAIAGAGRLTDTGAGVLRYGDIFSSAEGVNTLVLSGSCDNACSSVTNGTGALRVVKEGSGVWRVHAPAELGGGAYAKEGTLRFESNYTWYRFLVRQQWGTVWGKSLSNGIMLFGLGLWDVNGDLLNGNLVHNAACDAKTDGLAPGEMAMTVPNTGYPRYQFTGTPPRSATNLFLTAEGDAYQDVGVGANLTQFRRYEVSSATVVPPTLNEKTSWYGLVFRLPEGKQAATTYDIRSYTQFYTENNNSALEPMAWSLEGSMDGHSWDVLHVVDSNKVHVTVAKNWYASNTVHHTGYAIASHDQQRSFGTIASVGAAQGATVETDRTITIGGLECDALAGCGTLKGFAFAAKGTVFVSGVEKLAEAPVFDYDFSACTDVENLSDWDVSFDGRIRPSASVVMTEKGLRIVPSGVLLIVR